MLRGLDVGRGNGDEPMVIKMAGRELLEASVTLYVRNPIPDAASGRVASVLDGFKRLDDAGVIENLRITECDESVAVPGEDADAAAVAYDEFVEAVGWESLEPFFKTQPGADGADRVVTFPPLCVAIRDADELTGLYPRWNDGTHESIEDCLNALATGDCVENVRR